MRVKRIVEKRRSLEDVGVVLAYLCKTLADGPQTRRLGGDLHIRRKVRAVHDPGESLERLVARKSLVDEGLKRAAAARRGGDMSLPARRSRRLLRDPGPRPPARVRRRGSRPADREIVGSASRLPSG